MNNSSVMRHDLIRWRLMDLKKQGEVIWKEMQRLMEVSENGHGHEFDPQMMRCWICGLYSMTFLDNPRLICMGPDSLKVLDFQI